MKSCGDVRGKYRSSSGIITLCLASDCLFPTWWNKQAYFVTTSEREFFSCADEKTCVEKAMEEVGKK